MKSSTLLDSVVFQLTPTRTRCDLVIVANEKKEKIATGLLTPYLAHLKTAQDQIAKGGYSILLQPESGSDAAWFTKGTVERFVRFVSTPEVLERVYTIESEILQIDEAIAIQDNNDIGPSLVEDHQAKPVVSSEGNKPLLDANEDKSIVLYKPGTHPPEANGSITQEGNSKVQLLKVLETRKTVLQKEQGMAFARAVAAGFDIDLMAQLVSFAECFGASRLMNACLRFMDLWKRKHETGQWLEIEALSTQSDFSTINASGIMLSNMANKQNESHSEMASENNVKTGIDTGAGERPHLNYQIPVGKQEYFQGQFPHTMFPPWPIHSPPGALPVFQAYPMQGMPYYQNYSGNGPFYPPHYQPAGDPHFNVSHRTGQKRQSMDSQDGNTESEALEMDASKTRLQDDLELEKEASYTQEPRKKAGRSGKKQSGMVVIRNINYITSKAKNSAGCESESSSDSETYMDGEDLRVSDTDIMHKNTLRSSKRKGSHAMAIHESNLSGKEECTYGKETDGGHWEAFQTCLLRRADEDNRTAKEGIFALEKDVRLKRRQNKMGNDPLVLGGEDPVKVQDRRNTELHKVNGNEFLNLRTSNDEILISGYDNRRGAVDDQMDIQFTEINGKKVAYRRKENDDFMMGGRANHSDLGCSSDPPTVNGFEGETYNFDRISSNNMADESFIVPFRSMSLDQAGTDNRTAVDVDSELPSTHQISENISNGIGSRENYVPDDLSLMPERGTERTSIGYDIALDYQMQACVEDAASLKKRNKEVETDLKQRSKKDKDRRSKVPPDNLDEKKTGGPIRKGKPSKMNPLDDARARAEKLRAFKADLQKLKKEKEEADLKRIELLKMERQKRIAARGSSTSAQSQFPSLQNRKLPTKLSPITHRGSKFSDSEPGSSSPLQRSKIRTASLGSTDFRKASKVSKPRDSSHLAANKLSRSASSLSARKKEISGTTPDSQASMGRIRRLSEPKTTSHTTTSVKLRSSNPVSKPKASDEPESKKISAIMNLDRSKAATLPELKIRTSEGSLSVSQNKLAGKEMALNVNGSMPSVTPESAEWNVNNDKVSHCSAADDNPIIEKTVVMLERERPSIPVVHASEDKIGTLEAHYDTHDTREKMEVVPEYAAIRVQPSPREVVTNYTQKESLKFTSISTAEKPYQAPFARVSSLEDPCTGHSEYGKALPANSEMVSRGVDNVKTLVPDVKIMKIEMIPEAMEKPQVKESTKGFRRFLKFGKKNHTSAIGEQNAESDNASLNGCEQDYNATNTAACSEVHTLKTLISQDETPATRSSSQKSSRHFSLLSPFRSKTSEKKLIT